MSVGLTINGVTYSYPSTSADTNWGTNATAWASAVTSGMLQKAGGTFTLTSEVNFGATYGLVAESYKSNSSNVSSVGELRLAVADLVGWRNNANSADLTLGVNGSNQLVFAGATFITSAGGTTALAADLNFTGFGLVAPYHSSDSSNIATSGKVRLANTDGISWRNAANSANLALASNSSNLLTFNGNRVLTGNLIATSQDLLIGGTTPVALPVGLDQQILTVSSGVLGYSYPRLFTANLNSSVTLTTSGATFLVSTGTAWTLSLLAPAAAGKGWHCYIKDQTGTANVNNITISRAAGGNIDGAASNYVINTSYGYVHLVCDGANWFIIT